MSTEKNCIDCGCKDNTAPVMPPLGSGGDCPNPEPCSTITPAQCVVFTGNDKLCGEDTVYESGNRLPTILSNIVDYFCGRVVESNPNEVTTEVVTSSTDVAVLYDAELAFGDVGRYEVWVVGKSGTSALFATRIDVLINAGENPQVKAPTVSNGSTASIPLEIGSDVLGDVRIFSDIGNNTFKITTTPASATSTTWKAVDRFNKISI